MVERKAGLKVPQLVELLAALWVELKASHLVENLVVMKVEMMVERKVVK